MSRARYMVVAVGVVFLLGGPFSASAATASSTVTMWEPSNRAGAAGTAGYMGNNVTNRMLCHAIVPDFDAWVSTTTLILYKVGSPTFNLQGFIMRDLTFLASSTNTVAASTITTSTSGQVVSFSFAPFLVASGTPYCIGVYTDGYNDSSNHLRNIRRNFHANFIYGITYTAVPAYSSGTSAHGGGIYGWINTTTCDESGSTLDCEGMVEAIASTTEAVVWTGHMQQYFYAILLLLLAAFGSYAFTKFFIKVW